MTDLQIIEQGPRHRVLVKPSGERIVQHIQAMEQYMRMSLHAQEAALSYATMTLMDDLYDRIREQGGEIINTWFLGWKEEDIIGDDGFVTGTILMGRARMSYWPKVDES